jgi:outer membrane lipoprotein-sorting protein
MGNAMLKQIKSFLFLLVLLFFIAGCFDKSSEDDNDNMSKSDNEEDIFKKPVDATYEVKSGIVTFENVITQGMNQTFYFDDYGNKEARYSIMDVELTEQKVSTGNVEIHIDSFLIRYDLQSREGTKIISHISIGGVKDIPKDFSKLTPEFIEDFNLKELGKKDILGKECKGYEVTVMRIKTEVWVWNGILLYSKVFMSEDGKAIEIKASNIEVNVPIPADKFKVPSDVNIISIGIDEDN